MYELRPQERRRKGGWIIPAICIVITVICFAIIAILLLDDIPVKPAARVKNIVSNVPPIGIAITPTQSVLQNVISKVVPAPTLVDKLRERAVGCTESARVSFINEAIDINNRFQDSFLLAQQTPKIALAPVVSSMQKAMRELEQLKPDSCGQIVKAHMLNEYRFATQAMLDFMAYSFGIDTTEKFKKAYELAWFGAYQIDIAGPFLIDDQVRLRAIEDKSQPVPDGLQYFKDLKDKKLGCQDAEFIQRVFDAVVTETTKADGFLSADRETPTPAPCVK